MSDSTQVESPHRISRRAVVKGGLVVGGTLWAAPVVQVITATKADAASGTTAQGISYVMLVLQTVDGKIVTAKLDVSGSVSCPGDVSADAKTLWRDYIGVGSNPAGNGWSVDTSAGCPSDLGTPVVTATSSSIGLGTSTLLGFMVHDGSLNSYPGKAGFASWTKLPDDGTDLPAGWGAPTASQTGGTVTFTKP